MWLFLLLLVVSPAYMSSLRLNPPSMAGLPFGAVLVAGGLAWSVLGATAIVATSSKAVRLFASVVFTLPALFVVILAPAVARILSNLAGAD